MIKTTDLHYSVQHTSESLNILQGINLHIQRGESIAIIGTSGSGKSTLLGLLAGLDSPSSGQIYLANTEITTLNEEQRAEVRARHVAFVFQNFQLLPSLTALENVSLPLELKNQTSAMATAKDYLNRVGLSDRETHYPHQLSGGEQQRVALARAFACKAPILFADEPTGNLDSETGERVSDLLFELNRSEATTLVLVTHDTTLARRCDRQLQMSAGKLEENTCRQR